MASGAIVGGGEGTGSGGGDGGVREKQRWADSKVYTRKSFKGLKHNATGSSNNNTEDNEKNSNNVVPQPPSQTLASKEANFTQEQLISSSHAASDDSSSLNRSQHVVPSLREALPSANGAVKQGFLNLDNRIKISMPSRSKQESQEIKRQLENELDMVRSLVRRIEAKQKPLITGFGNSLVRDVLNNGGVKRVYSEVASGGVPHESSRPLNQLSISVIENSQGVSENLEKEKRTPKANQFYRNSEFLLAKDKFPPAESNKKSKSSGKKSGGGEMGLGFGTGSKFFKSCSALLEKLMKHKHGWVFNAPVDAKALGLLDYFTIIKHPMDLGTVKSRLNKNWYKSPKEFAEDVRLTFHNAMTYNPKGQDVNTMADLLLQMFEEKWAVIEAEYNRELRYSVDYDAGLTTPTSRRAPLPYAPLMPHIEMRRALDRSESMTHSVDPKSKFTNLPSFSSRTPALKKPKAKDPHKRDMTYDEKQKLSTNLQSLPSEKLDNIVQIIKKRNSALSQYDDEIEVDIDSVDNETLWELDRFVTNYKKGLSKNKRKAELAIQPRPEAKQNVQEKMPVQIVAEDPKESKTGEKNASSSSPVQVEKQGDNASRSSSSSSSSSDSESSSSDSDSDSSSASGSDAGHSPKA